MRILFVSDYLHLPDVKGGLQTTTHDLCLLIGVAGGEAAVLCGLPKPVADQDSKDLTRSDETLGYLCIRASSPLEALPSVAAAWDPSIIVVQSGTALAPMVLASQETGRPTAVYLHNVETHQLGGMLVPDPSLLYLANSTFTSQRWHALYGLQCAVIPPVVRAQDYWSARNGNHVLFVNPVPIKGVELMFAIAAQCPDIPFLVVESWNLSPSWREWCIHRARQLGNVQWLLPNEDMRPIYAQARVLLMPSVWEESFGRTVVEAQINGLPVLASQRGALPQIVGDSGLTLDPHAPAQQWADALRYLLENHGRYSAAARKLGLGHAAAAPLIVADLMGRLAQHCAAPHSIDDPEEFRPDVQPVVDQAWRYFAMGDLPEAIESAHQAVQANDHAPAALAALGYFLMQSGRTDEAADVLLPAQEHAPGYAPLHLYSGYLLQRLDNKPGALQAFERACRLDATLDDAAYALAWVLFDLGRLQEAAHWAARALAQARLPQRMLQMGWLMQAQKHFTEAIAYYREAVAAFPATASEQPRLHLHLAQCLAQLGQTTETTNVLQYALEQWPHEALLWHESIERCQTQGDAAGALQQAQAFAKQQPQHAVAWHLLGVHRQKSGDLEAADAAFARCQELDPDLTDALTRRANIQRQWNRFEGAKWLLDLVLRQHPDDEGALDLYAQVLLDLHQDEAARRLLLQRVQARPSSSDLWRLMSVPQSRRGRPRAALRWARKALLLDIDSTEALRQFGWLSLELGELGPAVEVVRRLLSQRPEDGAAHIQAAFVFERAGLLGEAQRWAEQAVVHSPKQSEAWRALSQVRLRQLRLDEAIWAIQRALQIAPEHADNLRQLGWVHTAAASHGQAQLAFLKAAELRPDDVACQLELAQAARRAGHFDMGLQVLTTILRARPTSRAALSLQAQLLVECGHSDAYETCARMLRLDRRAPEAVRAVLRLVGLGESQATRLLALVPALLLRTTWRDAIAQSIHTQSHDYLLRLVQTAHDHLDDDPWFAAARLYAASLSADSTAEGLAKQARAMYRGMKISSGLSSLSPQAASNPGDLRPRIAYIDSQQHQGLMRRVLATHSAQRAHVFLYTNQVWMGLPAHVRVQPLVAATLADSCAANRIDVVIDTGGLHPFEGQYELLQAYAQRLAPVQLGWLGCWGSGGGLFDGLLADADSVPRSHEAHYEESILRLNGGQWCWDPPQAAPEVSPSPLLDRGAPTYGVTARSLRLGGAALDTFARVVAATPQSSIRFIGEVANDWPLRRQILTHMHAHGVESGRVFFDPRLPYTDYLAWFSRIDVVLDSLPGNGGLTLLDPLWMGVPVITLAGAWAGARQGASVLSALGFSEWVAHDVDAYCNIAVALSQDRAGLARHRNTLRKSILNSALVDGRRVAGQIEEVCLRLKLSRAVAASEPHAKARIKAFARLALDEWMACPRRIALPHVPVDEVPDVSVIIVLFNQAGLSRRTLQALADQVGVRFETIIVDNASSDRTSELLDRVHGARIIRNTDNIGFLLAARQGADAARGRYLAFLNSDAILQEDALANALRCIQADQSIGVLGGRVVLTDGGLQEAGNMVFCDGSAGGIGRNENPFEHAALAARSTDYVSGVFMLTPMSLWRTLGGFDVAFAPAYYEDTDYCLRTWQAGFRVVYEPSVLLEHLEWGSATNDSATQLMERNRTVFSARHASFLLNRTAPKKLSLDRDRWLSPEDDVPGGARRPRVLFIENEVPHMFKGGGLPRARLMLQALGGLPVTLFPLWETHDEWKAVCASIPNTVEVALGYGLAGLESLLQQRRGLYDVLLVSRPPNLQALAPLRARRPELFAGMRLVYDAEALFALREIAMAGVKGRPLQRAQADERIASEMALAADASDVLVVSKRDARYFEEAGRRTHILSHSIAARRDAPGVRDRTGLLFVGALHPDTPNEDGLLWFIQEVLPRLSNRLEFAPVLSVVGVCLSDRVAKLASPQIHILGAQADLEPHYDAARVFVAPVRFAGGVPAKVIEAAAHGIPVVASALLVRQLEWRDGHDIFGARDADVFAAAIARLLTDDVTWLRQQQAAWEQCESHYAPEMFGQTLRRVLRGLA